MKRFYRAVAVAATLWTSAGFVMAEPTKSLKFICELKGTQGHEVKGFVKFIQRTHSVTIRAHVEGLTPGKHGFHIHECGDCSAPDASSAKGHFNPGKHHHGGPSAMERHAGDLGNLNANAQGVADYERTDKIIHMTGNDSILGKAIIVHEKVDDYKTQPTGNAGSRIACGVILTKEDFQKSK